MSDAAGAPGFRTPSAEEWIDALGVEPQPEADDEDVLRVVFAAETGDAMDVSYAPAANSVQFRWLRDGELLLDITREGARRMWVESGQGAAHIRVEFDVRGLRGALTVQLLPSFRVQDSMLVA